MTAPDPAPQVPVIEIPAGEHGKLRLFRLNMRPEQLAFLRDEPGALAQILGVPSLDRAHADLFDVADLEELGLVGYLTEGCGLASEDLTADHDMLMALTGPMLVLRSRAFGGEAVRLTPADQISLIATFTEPAAKWSARQVTSNSAKPQPHTPKVPPRQARAEARRLGFIFFVVVMSLFLLVLALLIL